MELITQVAESFIGMGGHEAHPQKLCGRWSYGPYESDASLDYAWELEKKLLNEALNLLKENKGVPGTNVIGEVAVVLHLLSEIENNSLDETKILWQEVKSKYLTMLEKYADEYFHDPDASNEGELTIKTFQNLVKKVDERIMQGEHEDDSAKELAKG